MDVVIKKIGKAEAQILERVAEDVFDHEIHFEHLAGYLDEPNHIMCLAIVDDLVVGQVRAMIHRHPDKASDLYIENLGVTPAFQRQGIAKRLLAEMVRLEPDRITPVRCDP